MKKIPEAEKEKVNHESLKIRGILLMKRATARASPVAPADHPTARTQRKRRIIQKILQQVVLNRRPADSVTTMWSTPEITPISALQSSLEALRFASSQFEPVTIRRRPRFGAARFAPVEQEIDEAVKKVLGDTKMDEGSATVPLLSRLRHLSLTDDDPLLSRLLELSMNDIAVSDSDPIWSQLLGLSVK